ncbi:MAG TPA: DUF2934 domain-containing protein [Terriglobia bacterium]|nr:DUF2934 domain-containing protein [Terriglobia bacterium]
MWLKDHHDDTRRHGSDQEIPKIEESEATLQDRIRQRAYELFQAKSGSSDMQDWLRAEREILHEMASQNESGTALGKGNSKLAATPE